MELISKHVPLASVPGLAALWLLCAAAIAFIRGGAIDDAFNAALAVPCAIAFYWLGEPLEKIFDHWYGWSDEKEGTRLHKRKGAFLPSGRDLNDARQAAIRVFPADANARYPGEGIYERAKNFIQQRSRAQWRQVATFSLLNKLFRGLVIMSLIVALGAAYLLMFKEQLMTDVSHPMLIAVIGIGIAFAPGFFIGFVRCKWEHMVSVYRLAVRFHDSASSDSQRNE